jgi:hypothetical protein
MKLNNFKYIVVLMFILSAPSLLMSLLAYKIGINNTIYDILLMGSVVFLGVSLPKSAYLENNQKNLLYFYIIILLYLLIIWNVGVFMSGSRRAIFKYFLTAPFLIYILNSRSFSLPKFIKYYLFAAFILSLLSIIQFVGVPLGLISLSKNPLRADLNDSFVGIGGFWGQLENSDTVGFLSRNIGFFSEPTNFAQFLMVPMFLVAYRTFYIGEKSKKNKFFFITIVIAFILTFSVANFFGLLVGLAIFFALRISNKYYSKRGLKKAGQIAFFTGLLFVGYQFYTITNSYSRTENIIGKRTGSNIDNRIGRNAVYFNRIVEKPFGDIDYKKEFQMATGFIGNIAIVGGYPMLIIVILFIITYISKIYFVAKQSKYLLIYIGLFAYLVPAIWDAHLYEYQFIFILVFYNILLKYDKHNLQIV